MQVKTPPAMPQSASASEAVVFAGIVSLITTPAGTADGPLFVTVIAYVVDAPAVTLFTLSSFVTDRSAESLTAVEALAESLAEAGSTVVAGAVTVAVLLMVPVAPALTVVVTAKIALAPLFRLTVVLILPLPLAAVQLLPT